jgi:hypothetical protein
MNWHPYRDLPAAAFWRKSVTQIAPSELDPVIAAPFRISRQDRVATAGSCFAQHIARHLRKAGFDFLITETAHPIVPADLAPSYNYGIYTARYGNLYTARQFLQLFQRAYGQFTPADDAWQEPDGRWTDPFRPQIQDDRYLSRAELEADRAHHFACVRRAFETADVFVFTLGLTESWLARADGAVYPVCPGTAGGRFDPEQHVFHNFTAAEVTADLHAVIDLLRSVNPGIKVILTVSPVPLVATAAGQHALVATTYSKAVLRVAADEIARTCPGVAYFPSFEIITGTYNRGAYFAEDCRSVTEEGVSHVMRVFLRHFTEQETAAPAQAAAPATAETDSHTLAMQRLVKVVCEEEALDRAG